MVTIIKESKLEFKVEELPKLFRELIKQEKINKKNGRN